MSATALALIAQRCGDPTQVLSLTQTPLRAPNADEIQVRMRHAPINPADLNLIAGSYGLKATPPFACGLEGAGQVEHIGAAVRGLSIGDWVRPSDGVGSWCTQVTAAATRFQRLPRLRDPEQAAMLAVNPATAWRLLHDFPHRDAPVLINGGSTNLGRCLIQLARALGIAVIATVRDATRQAELLALGAQTVICEGRDARDVVAAIRAAGPAPRVAINQVGGDSAATQLRALSDGGTQVTVGGLSLQPITVGTGSLIFKDLSLCGFWMSRWYAHSDAATQERMFTALGQLIDQGQLLQPVAERFPLARWHDALAATQRPRLGKIVFTCDEAAS